MMEDYLLKSGETKFKYILRGGYNIQENQDIVLAKETMADGTERRNIAEKKKTTIQVTFSQIDGQTLKDYNEIWRNDFPLTYWSKDDRTYKQGTFRVEDKPENSLLLSTKEIYDEFDVEMESV